MNEKYLVKVADTFGVELRLREIDEGYRVFYNKAKHRYEIHNVKMKPNTLVLVSPYDELDARTIKLVRKTSVAHAEELFRNIEEHNEKIIKKQQEEELYRVKNDTSRAELIKSLLEKRR